MEKLYDLSFENLPDRVLTMRSIDFPFSSVIVFGGGSRGSATVEWLKSRGVFVPAVVDNDRKKHGGTICDVVIVPPTYLDNFKCPVLIASVFEYEIFMQLSEMNLRDVYFSRIHDDLFIEQAEEMSANIPRLNSAYERLVDDESRRMFYQAAKMRTPKHDGVVSKSAYQQYDHHKVFAVPGDVILDVGGMRGETAIQFATRANMDCKVYTFEPSPCHAKDIGRYIQPYSGIIEHVCLGAWSHATTLRFNADFLEDNPGSHRIDQDGTDEISVIDIDSFVSERCISVDLIKMDIEGAELEALHGARETIARYLPKLQISIYHKASHLWEIIEFIDGIDSGYEYYVGHHSSLPEETVLYARKR